MKCQHRALWHGVLYCLVSGSFSVSHTCAHSRVVLIAGAHTHAVIHTCACKIHSSLLSFVIRFLFLLLSPHNCNVKHLAPLNHLLAPFTALACLDVAATLQQQQPGGPRPSWHSAPRSLSVALKPNLTDGRGEMRPPDCRGGKKWKNRWPPCLEVNRPFVSVSFFWPLFTSLSYVAVAHIASLGGRTKGKTWKGE